jgi:hypothetical protein
MIAALLAVVSVIWSMVTSVIFTPATVASACLNLACRLSLNPSFVMGRERETPTLMGVVSNKGVVVFVAGGGVDMSLMGVVSNKEVVVFVAGGGVDMSLMGVVSNKGVDVSVSGGGVAMSAALVGIGE